MKQLVLINIVYDPEDGEIAPIVATTGEEKVTIKDVLMVLGMAQQHFVQQLQIEPGVGEEQKK